MEAYLLAPKSSKSVLAFSEGMKKRSSDAANIAIPASVKPDKGTKLSSSVLNIHAPAAKREND